MALGPALIGSRRKRVEVWIAGDHVDRRVLHEDVAVGRVDREALAQNLASGGRAAVICFANSDVPSNHVRLEMPQDSDGYAAGMYDALRRADESGCERIVIERPLSQHGLWSAIHDRLRRATTM